jgi:hypothetical protein
VGFLIVYVVFEETKRFSLESSKENYILQFIFMYRKLVKYVGFKFVFVLNFK